MPRRNLGDLPHETDICVGDNLRRLRIFKGISQADLGRRLELSYQQIQKYETAATRVSASKLLDIANILEVTPNYFFGLEGKVIEEDTSQHDREVMFLIRSYNKISNPEFRMSLRTIAKQMSKENEDA